jgi:hypothetical protein
VSFLAAVGMSWLDGAAVPREELRDHCITVLGASLGTDPGTRVTAEDRRLLTEPQIAQGMATLPERFADRLHPASLRDAQVDLMQANG